VTVDARNNSDKREWLRPNPPDRRDNSRLSELLRDDDSPQLRSTEA
jgi:hypothetical protein